MVDEAISRMRHVPIFTCLQKGVKVSDTHPNPSMDIHRVRFVQYDPQPVHCLRFHEEGSGRLKLALSRGDGSIEIWTSYDGEGFFKDLWVPGRTDFSIEALVWCAGRLFSAGLTGRTTI